MTTVEEKLFGMKIKRDEKPTLKVSIVGCGKVGMTIAYTLLTKVNNNNPSILLLLKNI